MAEYMQDRVRQLEDLFFAENDAKLIAKQRELEHMERTQQALSSVSGITNRAILRKLAELQISPQLLASLAVVPLVEVAWADGSVDAKERSAILDGAAGAGIGRGTVDFDLLDEWLQRRPPPQLIEAWVHYICGLCEALTAAERDALKADLLTRAHAVAKAAGGFLGLARVSAAEKAVLARMEKAFNTPPTSTTQADKPVR